MSLTQQRIEQIGVILSRPERPSTVQEISEHVGIHKSHINRLLQRDATIYKAYSDNKRHQQFKRLKDSMSEIEQHAEANDVSMSYACLALGYDQSRYSQLKAKMRNYETN